RRGLDVDRHACGDAQLAAAGDRLQRHARAAAHPAPAAAGGVPFLVVPAVEVADRAGHRTDARLEVAPREEREEPLARAAEVHRGRTGAAVIGEITGVAQRRQLAQLLLAVDEVRVVAGEIDAGERAIAAVDEEGAADGDVPAPHRTSTHAGR